MIVSDAGPIIILAHRLRNRPDSAGNRNWSIPSVIAIGPTAGCARYVILPARG